MNNYIIYSKLNNEEKKYWLDTVVACKLQQYIIMFEKMKKAGVTPKEIILLRGLPMTPKEVEEKLNNNKIAIKVFNNNECSIKDID